jgi:hypothetical protein
MQYWLLPKPGSPTMSVTVPQAMRPGQSQRIGLASTSSVESPERLAGPLEERPSLGALVDADFSCLRVFLDRSMPSFWNSS